MTLAIVRPPLPKPRCGCEKCRHRGAAIHREYIEGVFSELECDDLEAEIVRRWHEYYPAFSAVLDALPRRALSAALSQTKTAALRRLIDWNDCAGEYADEDDLTMAVLAGPPGTGKTVAASWIALHRRAQDEPVFLTAPELQRRFRDRDDREQLLFESMVIVDDLGAEQLDERFRADFDELVDALYQRLATLVVTTNCSSAQFAERYGARVVDRLAEVGAWISVGGKSLRRRSR